MPQIFQHALGHLSDLATRALRGQSKEEHPARGPEVAESPPPEDLGRKRAREDEGAEVTSSNKKTRVRQGSPSNDTRRRGARPYQGLAIPDHLDTQEAATTGIKCRMERVKGHNYKPMNTLNSNRHETSSRTAKEQRLLSSVPEQLERNLAKKGPSQLSIVRGSQQHFVPAKHSHGDGARNGRFASPPKRQKTENHIQSLDEEEIKYETQSEHEEDYLGGSTVAAVNGRPVSRSPLSDGTSAFASNIAPRFGAQEYKEVSKYTDPQPTKKRRKPMQSSQNSQQSSERSSPANIAPNSRAYVLGKTRELSVIEIPDDDDSQPRSTNEHMTKSAAASADTRKLTQAPSNLLADVAIYVQHSHSPHSKLSQGNEVYPPRREKIFQPYTDRKNELLISHDHGMERNANQPRKSPAVNGISSLLHKGDSSLDGVSLDDPANAELARRSRSASQDAPLSEKPFARFIQAKEPSADLRTNFKRDRASASKEEAAESSKGVMPPPPRPPATKRRSVESSVSTEDELQGETTVGSGMMRSTSPLKPPASRSQVQGTAVGQLKSSNAGHPKHALLMNAANLRKEERRTGKRSSKSNALGTEHSFSIVAIHCRGCWQRQPKALELVWDPSEGLFYARLAGDYLRLPTKEEAFNIDPEKVQSVSLSDDSSRIIVKGAVTDNSNGKMLIEFANPDEADRFHFTLLADTKIQRNRLDQVRLDKQFEHLIKEVGADHERHIRNSKSTDDEQELALLQHRRASRAQLSASPDSAQHQQRHQPSRASQMRSLGMPAVTNNGPPPARQSGVVSHHFENELRRSTRQSLSTRLKTPTPPPPEPIRWTEQYRPKRWAHSVVYPTQGAKRVTVDFDDLERLDEGQFFNDNIISFALRQIQEAMPPETRDSVHFFSTFFYSSLTAKATGKGINYDAVKRWTKNIDLFNYPFVVIPINIELHWFVMIIVNLPNVERRLLGDEDDLDAGAHTNIEAMEDLSIKDTAEQTAARDVFTFDKDDKIQDSPLSTRSNTPEALALLDAKTNPGKKTKAKTKGPPLRKADPNKPTIVTLDSFGSTHGKEVRLLKLYLSEEAREKRNMDLDPGDQTVLSGLTAKGIPEQQNFCDCGVYVVGYIQEFAKDPRKFVNKIFRREMDKTQDFASFDPSEKRTEIRNALLALHEEQSAARRREKEARMAKTTSSSAARPTRSPSKLDTASSNEPSRSTSPQKNLVAEAKSNGLPVVKSDVPYATAEGEMDELEVAVPHAAPSPHPGSKAHVAISTLQEAMPAVEMESALQTSETTMAVTSIAEMKPGEQLSTHDARTSHAVESSLSSPPQEQEVLNHSAHAQVNLSRQETPATPIREMSADVTKHPEDSDFETSSTGSNIIVSSPANPYPRDNEYSILAPLKQDVDMSLSQHHDSTNKSTMRSDTVGLSRAKARSLAQHADRSSSKEAKIAVKRSSTQQHESANRFGPSSDARKTRTSPRLVRPSGNHTKFDD